MYVCELEALKGVVLVWAVVVPELRRRDEFKVTLSQSGRQNFSLAFFTSVLNAPFLLNLQGAPYLLTLVVGLWREKGA